MKLYALRIKPTETDGEGEDHDEWFTSLEAAMQRRKDLIQENPYGDGLRDRVDYEIDRVELVELPPRELALRILNRSQFIKTKLQVVPPYFFPRDTRPFESIFEGSE